jgi:pyruvate/2-oxoglutarate dehydrogenase complex dihydrolipoamide acyltransferase (E2) component
MIIEIVMPQLGETVNEGTIATWRRAQGERIRADETLFEVESDKATMDVPAPASGMIQKICVEAGRSVAVGTVVAILQADDGETT